uniref:Uncharacterized protein n=1 Tax=Anopheles coluzzii TaxID=1518534 RepID=A0A8W7PX28_ANOCL
MAHQAKDLLPEPFIVQAEVALEKGVRVGQRPEPSDGDLDVTPVAFELLQPKPLLIRAVQVLAGGIRYAYHQTQHDVVDVALANGDPCTPFLATEMVPVKAVG